MDYKRKYEQAMLRMNKWVEGSEITDPKEVAEFVFPELKESKEESIRKSIIELVKQSSHILNPMNQKSMIGWLEKQAEHNPIDKVEPKFKVGDKITEKDFDECYDGIIKEIKNGKYFFENGDCFDIKEQDLWQLIEQKPAWSEEDENGLGDALWAIEQARTIAKNENEMGNLWYAEKWLKSIKERVQPKPKQEWSEEDERMFTLCASSVRTRYNDGLLTYNEYEQASLWLKSLKERMKEE